MSYAGFVPTSACGVKHKAIHCQSKLDIQHIEHRARVYLRTERKELRSALAIITDSLDLFDGILQRKVGELHRVRKREMLSYLDQNSHGWRKRRNAYRPWHFGGSRRFARATVNRRGMRDVRWPS